ARRNPLPSRPPAMLPSGHHSSPASRHEPARSAPAPIEPLPATEPAPASWVSRASAAVLSAVVPADAPPAAAVETSAVWLPFEHAASRSAIPAPSALRNALAASWVVFIPGALLRHLAPQSVAVPLDVNHHAVVQEAVQDGRHDHRIVEELRPVGEGF